MHQREIFESHRLEGRMLIPCTTPVVLVSSLEGFTEFTNLGGKLRMSESRWLGHEDFLMESPMKECIVHIKLAYGPVVRES